MTGTDQDALLQIHDLSIRFRTGDGYLEAVRGVSYSVYPGEIVGVVGESGSGKSVTAMSILGLVHAPGEVVSGQILFEGNDLLTASAGRLREIRGSKIAMIFQDPMTALNPVIRIGDQLGEAVRLHDSSVSRAEVRRRVVTLLQSVGIPDPESRRRQYPHELSGGMRQRAMIAMALANDPDLLIADEPTTALDVTIQAQVLELLRNAAERSGAATILITHDLGVIAELADRVVVMYGGRVVEQATVSELFDQPRHPYTIGLLASMPRLDQDDDLHPIPGSPPDATASVDGCAFHPRCRFAQDLCRRERPELRVVADGRQAACHFDVGDWEPSAAPGLSVTIIKGAQ